MTLYINKALYTDVQSWKVIELDEEKGEATVIEVEKKPENLNYELGGFVAHFSNLNEAFRNAPIVEVKNAKPFKLYRRKNGWFKKQNVGYSLDKRIVDLNNLKEEQNTTIVVDEFSVHFLKTTKTGKLKETFTKFCDLNAMSENCNYFYDYNF